MSALLNDQFAFFIRRRRFKLLIIIFFSISGVYAQCPDNIGFESGNLNNWVAYSGQISRTGTVTLDPTPPAVNRHKITQASEMAIDTFGHFPTVSPNGSKFSVRLGNDRTGAEAERLSYTFTVPQTTQYSLILNYAVVLQNANHREFEQPRFIISVFNITDAEQVECPAFNFIASSNLPGFKKSSIVAPGISKADVYYKDWAATTINLSAYGGKQIRIEFTTHDCTPGGDFGYAYFDLNEECTRPITGNIYCQGQSTVNLVGPKGFANYTWYNANMSQELGHEQILKLDPIPPDGTQYVLKVTALDGWGCPDVFNTTVTKSPTAFNFKLKGNELRFCKGGSADLTASSVTEGSSPGLVFKYYKDPLTLEYLRDPDKVTEPGTYYIHASNAEGCLDILPIEIKMHDEATITVTDPAPVKFPATVDLSLTFSKTSGYTYSYYRDEKATQPVADYLNVGLKGKYYIKAVNAQGCETIAVVNVNITPPAHLDISYPTAFTPNSDGVNDTFSIKINGFLKSGSLSVYNRTGQLLFKTNNITEGWDGNFNGRSLPPGTYYWLFNGVDAYFNSRLTKGGYVSIIK
jgi:gliding motility-associated-like protein